MYIVLGLFVYLWIFQHLLTNATRPHILQYKVYSFLHYFRNNNNVIIKIKFPSRAIRRHATWAWVDQVVATLLIVLLKGASLEMPPN